MSAAAGGRSWMWLPEDLTSTHVCACGAETSAHCLTCSACPGTAHLAGYVCAEAKS